MSGRAARPIEDIVADCATWYGVPVEILPAEVGPGHMVFRLEGLPEPSYFRGRLVAARYEAILRPNRDGGLTFDVRWRGRDDAVARSRSCEPPAGRWPPTWPPPLPDGLPLSLRKQWDDFVRSAVGRPYAVAAGTELLQRWIEAIAESQVHGFPRGGHDELPSAALAASWRRAMETQRRLMRFADQLGQSPLARQRAGERHERERRRRTALHTHGDGH